MIINIDVDIINQLISSFTINKIIFYTRLHKPVISCFYILIKLFQIQLKRKLNVAYIYDYYARY